MVQKVLAVLLVGTAVTVAACNTVRGAATDVVPSLHRVFASATDDHHATFVIERRYPSTPSQVFHALADKEAKSKWFADPRQGSRKPALEMDFRVGGKFRFGMTGPEGNAGPPFGAEYLEIVPNKKIVYDNGFDGAPKMLLTISFDEIDGSRTRLTIHTLFPTVAMKNEHVGYGYVVGIESGLDQFADFVAELQAGER